MVAPMKARIVIAVLFLLACSAALAERTEASRAIIKMRLVTEYSRQSQTVIFTLEPGVENLFGSRYPKLRVLVLPLEADQVPLQISLVAESGQTLSSTTVYYTPEIGAEFSLDAEGIDAQGKISSFSKGDTE